MNVIDFKPRLLKKRTVVLIDVTAVRDPSDDFRLTLDHRVKKIDAFFRRKLGEVLDMPLRNHEQMPWHEPRVAEDDEDARALFKNPRTEKIEIAEWARHTSIKQ